MINFSEVYGLGVAYARSFSSFHLGGKPKPFSVGVMVTNKCNLRCEYCNYPFLKSKEMSIEELDFLFDKFLKMGIKRLGISGGEPMVRKDLPDIIRLAKSKGFFVSLNSNLLLYDKFKGKLDGVDYFMTSIDGDPITHGLSRGNSEKEFQKIIDAIRDIKSMKKKLSVICVISQPSKKAVDYVLDLAIKENIDVHFQQEGYSAEIVGRDQPLEKNNELYREIWEYIYQKKKEGFPVTSSKEYIKYHIQWKNYSYTAINDSKMKCSARYSFLFVDPSGTAFPCGFTKGKVKGINLLKEDWIKTNFEELPCSTCIGGPYLEHNLLYRKPISSSLSAISKAF